MKSMPPTVIEGVLLPLQNLPDYTRFCRLHQQELLGLKIQDGVVNATSLFEELVTVVFGNYSDGLIYQTVELPQNECNSEEQEAFLLMSRPKYILDDCQKVVIEGLESSLGSVYPMGLYYKVECVNRQRRNQVYRRVLYAGVDELPLGH